jgi:hypothetical protein
MARKLNKRLMEMTNEELYALNPLTLDQLGRIALAAEKERRRRRAIEDERMKRASSMTRPKRVIGRSGFQILLWPS